MALLFLLMSVVAFAAQPTLTCKTLNEIDMARFKTDDFVRDQLIAVFHAVPPISNEHIDAVYMSLPSAGLVAIQYLTGHCVIGAIRMPTGALNRLIGREA